jgi:hypothetical protein
MRPSGRHSRKIPSSMKSCRRSSDDAAPNMQAAGPQWALPTRLPWSVEVSGISGEFSLGIAPASPAILHEENGAAVNTSLSEGGSKTVELTTYERNATARRLCIEHYGLNCQACGMNYEDKYGAIGADLIHVHHVTPLSSIGEAYQIDPVRDLVPLCASCHHVAHQRTPPYPIAEIRHAVATQRLSSRIVSS